MPPSLKISKEGDTDQFLELETLRTKLQVSFGVVSATVESWLGPPKVDESEALEEEQQETSGGWLGDQPRLLTRGGAGASYASRLKRKLAYNNHNNNDEDHDYPTKNNSDDFDEEEDSKTSMISTNTGCPKTKKTKVNQSKNVAMKFEVEKEAHDDGEFKLSPNGSLKDRNKNVTGDFLSMYLNERDKKKKQKQRTAKEKEDSRNSKIFGEHKNTKKDLKVEDEIQKERDYHNGSLYPPDISIMTIPLDLEKLKWETVVPSSNLISTSSPADKEEKYLNSQPPLTSNNKADVKDKNQINLEQVKSKKKANKKDELVVLTFESLNSKPQSLTPRAFVEDIGETGIPINRNDYINEIKFKKVEKSVKIEKKKKKKPGMVQ
ncbi:hypothetical protein G9A89_003102 [Geosiphon pyriformis]|nr:hypothetical protein G9A89_003102 [Geosiphon pyriformis]